MQDSTRTFRYLLILTHLSVSAGHVTATVGDMVTLPCTYSISYGTTTMCWGRGQCPSSKCNNQIIWTDGKTVTWRKSDKYQLMGDIEKGNVTLTIAGVTSEDAGSYCCRVEIPGIFNDQKSEINVKIKEETFSLPLYTSSPVNVSWTTTLFQTEEGYYSVQYTIIALLIVLSLLFGILLYRNQYHEKKMNDLSNTVSAISLGTLEAAQTMENVYVKMQ